MDNKAFSRLFSEFSDLMELQGANPFKIRAYQRAVQAIDNLTESITEVYKRGEVEKIDGIGKGIAEKIAEYIETEKIVELEELRKAYPEGILDLMNVPGLGPKKVKLVFEKLNIASVTDLKKAAEEGKLAGLPGMGKKTEEKILKGITTLEQSKGRFTLGEAYPVATEILQRIRDLKSVKKAEIAGSLRRGKETIGDVDILAVSEDPKSVMEEFLATENIRDVLANGETKSSILLENLLQVDLRVVAEESFGAALQYFTGSKEHNVKLREIAVKKGLKVNEYGVFEVESEKKVSGKDEEEVYQSIGMVWIPPVFREGLDEIELARHNKLPNLIQLEDIQSALHNHTTASDGSMTLEELVQEAKHRGYKIIAVTDHSVSLGVANGLSPDRLKRQIEDIQKLNEKVKGIRVLTGTEVDIKADGSLDFDDTILEQLDVVVASVHVALEQPKDKITDRVCKAISNPNVDILGHPSGRLLGKRAAMEIDFEKVFEVAARMGTIMEINAHYMRLDLKDSHIQEAKKYGIRFSINTDTHSAENFNNLKFGIQTAQRGRLEKQDVINTYDYNRLEEFLRS